jgi:hypothetical protein
VAYNTKNLQLITPRLGSGDNLEADPDSGYAIAIWSYRALTADDALADMQDSGFIDDADERGLKIGDIVVFVEDTVDAAWGVVDAITASAADTIILSNP